MECRVKRDRHEKAMIPNLVYDRTIRQPLTEHIIKHPSAPLRLYNVRAAIVAHCDCLLLLACYDSKVAKEELAYTTSV